MIPDGWKQSKLSVMAYAFSSKDFVPDGVPLVRMGNLYQNQFQLDRNPVFLPELFLTTYERFSLEKDDLIMSMTGTMGKRDYGFTVQVPLGAPRCLLNQRVMKIIPKAGSSKRFLLYLLRSELILNRLYSFPGGTKQANLSAKQVVELPALLPPLPEQKKIAQILSTWDKAIETVEKLIENSSQKKKTLMQQLLTGKKRFPGFDGEWKEVRLGDIGDISSAGVDKKIVEGEEPVCLLNYLDILNRDFIKSNQLNHWVTAPDRKVKNCNVQKGDVFFTPSSETRDDIAHSAVAVETIPEAVYSYHIVRFRLLEKWDLLFRAYAFKMPAFYKQAYSLCEGSGQRYVISQGYFRNMTVRIPTDVEEQQKIASVLFSADREIETWQQELEYLKQEKKALMQQLLTGKKRVAVSQ